jgi:uncharacterized protein
MAKKPNRIIIDTNLWIAFLITRDFKKLDHKITSGKVKVVFSPERMEEFLAVADRPKFKKYFSRQDVSQLLDLLDTYGVMVDVKSTVNVCRDPKDNFLLALAQDSNAHYLITGDQDLLALKKFGKTSIITIAEYL